MLFVVHDVLCLPSHTVPLIEAHILKGKVSKSLLILNYFQVTDKFLEINVVR